MPGKLPSIGGGINLISKAGIRYAGILHTINSDDATITLAKVRSLGAENRSMPVYDEVYEHIIFKASDIKDLVVCELSKLNQEQQSYVNGNNTEPVIQSLESCTPNIKMRQQIPHADVKQAQYRRDASQINNYGQYYKNDNGCGNGFRRTQDFHNHSGVRRNNVNPFYSNLPKERLKFDSDYDFEKANEQFRNTVDALGIDMLNFNLKDCTATVVMESVSNEEKMRCEEDTGEIPNNTSETCKPDKCYDKKTSFFDSISCDTHEKTEGKNFRPDWKKERLTNQETFGHFAVRSLEYRRGRNGYRLTRNRFVRPRFCNNNATLSGGGFGQARSGNNTDSNTGMTNISFGTIGRRFPPFSRKRSTSRITRKSLSAVSTIKN